MQTEVTTQNYFNYSKKFDYRKLLLMCWQSKYQLLYWEEFPLTQDIQNSQIHRIRKNTGKCQRLGQGEGTRSQCLMDTEFQFRKVKNFGIWMMVRVAQYRECTWCHCTGNMVKTVCCTLCDFTTILKYIHTHTHTHTHI